MISCKSSSDNHYPKAARRGLEMNVLEYRARQRDEQDRRAMFQRYQTLDPFNTFVVDESSFSGKEVRRRRGRTPRGDPASTSRIMYTRTGTVSPTFIGCADINGFITSACCLVTDQTVDGELFRNYMLDHLGPLIAQRARSGSIPAVIIDNA